MELDKKIHNILAEASEERKPAVPAWDSMSGAVVKQNFLTAGFFHFNIYNLVAAVLFVSTPVTYYAFHTESAFVQPSVPVEVVEGIVEIEATPTVIEKPLSDEGTVPEPLPSTSTLIEEPRIKAISSRAEEVQEVVTIEAEVVPTTEIQESVEENTIIATPAPPRREAKKIIVFETDTVQLYDTLVKEKKRRRR